MIRRILGGIIYLAGIVFAQSLFVTDEPGAAALAQDKPSTNWLQTPPGKGAQTPQDIAARKELLQWLEEDQDDEFRQSVRTTVPECPTGLPANYDVAIYGSYIGSIRCVIQVRDGSASGELQATMGVRRFGKLPTQLIDARVRQLAYASMARYEPRSPDAPPVGTKSGRGCTHIPFLRIDVVSREEGNTWRLATDSRQVCGGPIDFANNGLRGYCHHRFASDVLDNADRWRDVTVESHRAAETLKELRDLVERVKRLGPLAERLRWAEERQDEIIVGHHDLDLDGLERAYVDGRILAFRAIDGRLRDAAPLLEQVGQATRAAHVRLVTFPNVAEVQKALKSSDFETKRAGLISAAALPPPTNADLLIETLPSPGFSWWDDVIKALETVVINEKQLARLREPTQVPETDQRYRLDLLGLAVFKADDEAAYRTLRNVASTNDQFLVDEFDRTTERALLTIFDAASRAGRRREDAATLARTWLSRVSSSAGVLDYCEWLAKILGFFGRADDIPQLVKLVERSEGRWRVAALQGLAALDSKTALELARRDFIQLLTKSADELAKDESFTSYLDLFFWQRDAAAIAMIKQALEGPPPSGAKLDPWMRRRIALLTGYVHARDLDERIEWAFAYLRDTSPRELWPRMVVAQLQADGADPDVCQALRKLVDSRWITSR